MQVFDDLSIPYLLLLLAPRISLQTRILWKIYANVSRVRCTSRGNGREKLLNREISEQAIKSVKR